MPIIEPLPLRHAVQLALPRRSQVRNPRVQLALERLRVVPAIWSIIRSNLSIRKYPCSLPPGTLSLPRVRVRVAPRARLQVAGGVPLGRALARGRVAVLAGPAEMKEYN